MENSESDELNRLIAVRAGIEAAMNMHISRSEELAEQIHWIDGEIEQARAKVPA